MKSKLCILLLSLLFSFYQSRTPDVISKNGLVVSSNKYASQIGVNILKNGGNAIDAAVAVGFALAVVHPSAGNLGGGGFMVIRLSDGTVNTIDFREKAPSNSSANMFLDDSLNIIPGLSWNTSLGSGVPGTVSGLSLAHEKYGESNWYDLIRPSIKLAKYGFKLDRTNFIFFNSLKYKAFLSKDSESKKIYYKDDGFDIGELFIQKDLSNTLSRIAMYGENEFYEGETADNIIKCMKRTNGIINKEDLKNYTSIERDPITFTYRGNTIYAMPLPSSGGIVLAQILKQLENLDFQEIDYQSSEFIHFIVEAERRAYIDRAEYLGDSDFNEIPVDMLISDSVSMKKWLTIDPILSTPSTEIYPGLSSSKYIDESEETTHYSIVDKWGNAVSVTLTLNGSFGNGIVIDGCGFLLNNEMDDFSSKPGHPNAYGLIGNKENSIEPNKRMLSSMTPTIIMDKNKNLSFILGTPGGSTIITTVAQIIINALDYNMNIKDAVESPRFHHQWLPDVIFFENNYFSKDVLDKLNDNGYHLSFRSSIGEANCIQIESDHNKEFLFYGAADTRRGATAVGY